MKHIIEITDYTRKKLLKNLEETIWSSISVAIEYLEFNHICEVSVLIVGKDKMKAINAEHRGKNKVTDVLSFPMISFEEEEIEVDPDTNAVYLGDIVLCADKVVGQAQKYGHSVEREAAFLVVHGILHLMGFDHEISKDEEKIQFELQEKIMEELDIRR